MLGFTNRLFYWQLTDTSNTGNY